MKKSSSHHQSLQKVMSENIPSSSASTYSKATTVQIEPIETGNGYHRFAGSSNPGGLVTQSANISTVSGGYLIPAQAGARFVSSSWESSPSSVTEMSYI